MTKDIAARIDGAVDILDETACLIWAELCPGMVMGDDDRPHYEAAAKAVLARTLDTASTASEKPAATSAEAGTTAPPGAREESRATNREAYLTRRMAERGAELEAAKSEILRLQEQVAWWEEQFRLQMCETEHWKGLVGRADIAQFPFLPVSHAR